MKKLFLYIIFGLLLSGCATVCPPQDIVIMTQRGPVFIPEGSLTPDTWWEPEEYNRWLLEDAKRRTF